MNNSYKRKKITMDEYNKKMAEIIKMGKPVADTLVKMLEEASKYELYPMRKKRLGKPDFVHKT